MNTNCSSILFVTTGKYLKEKYLTKCNELMNFNSVSPNSSNTVQHPFYRPRNSIFRHPCAILAPEGSSVILLLNEIKICRLIDFNLVLHMLYITVEGVKTSFHDFFFIFQGIFSSFSVYCN